MGAKCAPWGIGPPPPNGRPPTTSSLPSQTEGTGHYLPGARGTSAKSSGQRKIPEEVIFLRSTGEEFTFLFCLSVRSGLKAGETGRGGGADLQAHVGGGCHTLKHKVHEQGASETFRTELRKTLLRTHLGLKISSQQSPPNPQRQS